MGIEVRAVTSEVDRRAVARLRYEIYVEELGKSLLYADDAAKTLSDDLDAASTIYAAFDDGVPVATGRVVPVQSLPADSTWRRFYGIEQFPIPLEQQVIYSKLMVKASHRGTMAIPQILVTAYEQCRSGGTEIGFLHCAPSLVPIYEVVGCRRYKKGEIDPEVGFRLPMVQLLGDVEHFARVKSPLLTSVRKFPANLDLAKWFKDALPQYSEPASVRVMNEDEFMKTLSKHVNHESSSLFDGLHGEDIQLLIRASSIMDVAPGDPILRKGDVGSEMYLILDGAVEISIKPNGTRRVLHTLGYGQVFGEASFLLQQARSADAGAIAPTKLLSIGAENFSKIRTKRPELAAKVLFNLSKTLCERLYSGG